MARTLLTPVVMAPQSAASLAALNLTATSSGSGLAPAGTGTGNGVQFPNYPGLTFLLVSVGGTPTTPTIAAGQLSAAVTLNALAINTLEVLGVFYSAMLLTGTQLVGVDFSSVTSILCTAIQISPVF